MNTVIIKYTTKVSQAWMASPSIELSGTYRFDYIDFHERDQQLTNHITGLKVLYTLSTKLSFSAYIQNNSAIHGIITNFRLRYNPREGNDFYFVFNEGRNTNLNRETPTLPAASNRSVLIKYTHTFIF